jgi:hypothetical protein
MPPLPEALATILKTNATAALAALMVIAEAHRGLFAWASRMIGVEPAAPPKPQPEPTSQRCENAEAGEVQRPSRATRQWL